MELYLLRHADADTIAETDEARPISEKGVGQARKVARFCEARELGKMRLLTSPLRRAYETAEIVARHLGAELQVVPWLASGMRPPAALEHLQEYAEETAVMLVGHEPDLSALIAHLLGMMSGDRIEIRKASVTRLTVDALEAGRGRLDFSIPCRFM